MSKLMFTLALTAAIAAGAGSAIAEEDPIAAAAAAVANVHDAAMKIPAAAVEKITAVEAAKNPAPTVAAMEKDAGVQTVIKMQDEGKFPEQDVKAKTAEEQVKFILRKNGIDEGRTGERYVAVIDVDIPTNVDPAKDEAFVLKRDILAKQLVMRMKQKIVEGLGSIFNATELVETFATNELTTVQAGIKVPTKPVFGVTLIAQAESWDGQRYHMAAAAAWSKVLEQGAKATLLGTPAAGKGGEKSVSQWLSGTDFSLICGPRQMIDPDGNRVFFGISARETGINSMRDRANKRAAQMSALSYLALALYSDVDLVTEQNAAMDVFETADKKADVKAWETIMDKLGQKATNRMLEGANEIYSTTVTHPISGKKMIVSVYSIDAKSVAAARVRIEEMIALRYITELANKRALGRHAGYQDKVDEAKNNTEEFEKGRQEGRNAVQQKLDAGKKPVRVAVPKVDKADAKSEQGTFSDTSKISNDF